MPKPIIVIRVRWPRCWFQNVAVNVEKFDEKGKFQSGTFAELRPCRSSFVSERGFHGSMPVYLWTNILIYFF